MFKFNRIIVALIGIPLLVFIYTDRIFFGFPLFLFSVLIVSIGLYEFYEMLKYSGKEVYSKFGICVGVAIVVLNYLKNLYLNPIFFNSSMKNIDIELVSVIYSYLNSSTLDILLLSSLLLLFYRVMKEKIKGSIETVSYTIFGVVYVAVFFSRIIDIYFLDIDRETNFINLLLILQILVWIADTSAGIVGVTFGRKIFKNGFTEISPKKSVEGAIGSLFFTGIGSLIVVYFLKNSNLSASLSFLFGVLVSLFSQIGDLVESILKRECGVKDSGKLLLGHGGILDRFDSMIFLLPIIYLFILR